MINRLSLPKHCSPPAEKRGDVKWSWTQRIEDCHPHNRKDGEEHKPENVNILFCTLKKRRRTKEKKYHLMIMICLSVVLVRKFHSPSRVVVATI